MLMSKIVYQRRIEQELQTKRARKPERKIARERLKAERAGKKRTKDLNRKLVDHRGLSHSMKD
jgi:hypothetical protein